MNYQELIKLIKSTMRITYRTLRSDGFTLHIKLLVLDQPIIMVEHGHYFADYMVYFNGNHSSSKVSRVSTITSVRKMFARILISEKYTEIIVWD